MIPINWAKCIRKKLEKHQGNSGNTPTGFRLFLQYSIFCIFISIYQVHPHHPEPHGGVALPGTLNPAAWRHGLYLSIFNILHFYINIQEPPTAAPSPAFVPGVL